MLDIFIGCSKRMNNAILSDEPTVCIDTIHMMEQLEPAAFAKHATYIMKKVLFDSSKEVQRAASCALRTFGDNLCVMLHDHSNISRHAALRALRDAGVGGYHVLMRHRQLSDRYVNARMELFNIELARLRESYNSYPPQCSWLVFAAKRNFEQEEERWVALMETALLPHRRRLHHHLRRRPCHHRNRLLLYFTHHESLRSSYTQPRRLAAGDAPG